jgi:hypothetical protein
MGYITNLSEYERLISQYNGLGYGDYRGGKEIVGYRTLTSKAFRNNDSTVTFVHFTSPIHYMDESGNLREIHEQLKLDFSGASCAEDFSNLDCFYVDQNSLQSRFPRSTNADGVHVSHLGQHMFTMWKDARASFVDEDGNRHEYSDRLDSIGQLKSLNCVVYPNTYPNTDEEFTVSGTKIKHAYILRAPPMDGQGVQDNDYKYMVFSEVIDVAEGISLWVDNERTEADFETQDSITLKNRNGDDVGYFSAPVVFEGGLNDYGCGVNRITSGESILGALSVRFMPSGILFETMVPVEWLCRPDATYPIVIDPTYSEIVPDSASDAYAWGDGSNYDCISDFLMVGYSANNDRYYRAGMRFTSISVPQGAGSRIIEARLTITSYTQSLTDSVYATIKAHDADDSPGFDSTPYLGDRTLTASSIKWDHTSPWTAMTQYTSPDIRYCIEEVVNRPGWTYNNAISIIWYADSPAGGHRAFYAYDSATSVGRPMLEITLEEEPSSPGGCFIATAAYCTPMAAEIQILRELRDKYLLTNSLGQGLVDVYYRTSPPIAGFITEHPGLKPVVRAGLMPIVATCSIVLDMIP